jgi:hypothetical protein
MHPGCPSYLLPSGQYKQDTASNDKRTPALPNGGKVSIAKRIARYVDSFASNRSGL